VLSQEKSEVRVTPVQSVVQSIAGGEVGEVGTVVPTGGNESPEHAPVSTTAAVSTTVKTTSADHQRLV